MQLDTRTSIWRHLVRTYLQNKQIASLPIANCQSQLPKRGINNRQHQETQIWFWESWLAKERDASLITDRDCRAGTRTRNACSLSMPGHLMAVKWTTDIPFIDDHLCYGDSRDSFDLHRLIYDNASKHLFCYLLKGSPLYLLQCRINNFVIRQVWIYCIKTRIWFAILFILRFILFFSKLIYV